MESYLNSHTNLSKIDVALDLLWRNDVDPNEDVLELPFYGRTFSITSPTCNTSGGTYDSEGHAAKYSKEVGILMSFEVEEPVEEIGITPIL